MQHKGEIVEKAIRQSGYSITRLAKKLGKSTRWMYYMFETGNVPIDYILEIGALIHYDFSEEIKELKKYKATIVKNQEVTEPSTTYKINEESPEHWKNKYLELLETHNQLLLEITKEKRSKLASKK